MGKALRQEMVNGILSIGPLTPIATSSSPSLAGVKVRS